MQTDEVLGYVFDGADPVWGAKAASVVRGALARGTLRHVNGSYAAILVNGEERIIVSDRLGTRPVYVARHRGTWLTSFDYWELAGSIRGGTLDRRSVSEMLSFGYVLGEATLLQEITEVPAASVVSLDGSSSKTETYWRIGETEHSNVHGMQDLLHEAQTVLENVADRAAKLAVTLGENNLGIALSITQGRDSRLVSWMLASRQIECTHLTTSDMGDSLRVPAEIANFLGSKLTVLTPWYHESSVQPDSHIVDGISPTTMYGVANHILGLVHHRQHDFVHIGGYLGGEIVGSHIDMRSYAARAWGESGLHYLIQSKHQKLAKDRLPLITNATASMAAQNHLGALLRQTTGSVLTRERQFNFEQRQRRFIIRAYQASHNISETFMPLYDNEFLDFWDRLPIHMLAGTTLFDRLLSEQTFIGPWKFLSELPANGRRISGGKGSQRFLSLTSDLAKKSYRRGQLVMGNAEPIFNHQWNPRVSLDPISEVVDIGYVTENWATLGWDVQRSIETVARVAHKL